MMPDPTKVAAVRAADFKLREAAFFLQKAKKITRNAQEFRFFFDAALDSIDGAKSILNEIGGSDKVFKRWYQGRLLQFHKDQENNIVLRQRISAHHRSQRASLKGIIEAGELICDLSVHDDVEYLHLLRPGWKPKDQRITWAIEHGGKHYDAIQLCEQVIENLHCLLSEVRMKLKLPPDRGLKRVRLQVLKAMPPIFNKMD